jgi:hypothetical protein
MARADARRASEDGGALVASVRVGRENKLTISTDAGPPIYQMPSPANPKATGLHRATVSRARVTRYRGLRALAGRDALRTAHQGARRRRTSPAITRAEPTSRERMSTSARGNAPNSEWLRSGRATPPRCLTRRRRMEHLWSRAGATGGNRWQMGRPRKWLEQPKTVAVGCDRLRRN